MEPSLISRENQCDLECISSGYSSDLAQSATQSPDRLGVVIGVAAVITMVTIGNGASTAIKTEIESFGNNQLMLRPGMRLGRAEK